MIKTIFSKEHKYTVKQLKKARLEAGLDQVEVAKILGRTQPHISKIEAGQRRLDITQIKEFAKIYKKDIKSYKNRQAGVIAGMAKRAKPVEVK